MHKAWIQMNGKGQKETETDRKTRAHTHTGTYTTQVLDLSKKTDTMSWTAQIAEIGHSFIFHIDVLMHFDFTSYFF